MSDFLGRVAARAVGQATVAQPRLRALFAEAEPASADSGLEVVETEVRTAAPVPHALPETPRTESPSRTSSPESEPYEVGARVRRQPRPSVANLAEPVAGSDGLRRGDDTQPGLEAETANAAPIEADLRETPAQAVTAVPIPAIPASSATAEAVSVAREEPAPAVRVHIGRLEVRANVQEPRPASPHRESPRHKELSLADYLRGRREAG